MKRVTIYSDGACPGNPGPGGWGAVLFYGNVCKELSGGDPATTNNRMELTAAIEALAALKEPCAIEFFTDSAYLRNGITKWVERWKIRGWVTNGNQKVKNEHLWKRLDQACARHRIVWHWVKGHSGNTYNDRCDRLAKSQISGINRQYSRRELKNLLRPVPHGSANIQNSDRTPRSSTMAIDNGHADAQDGGMSLGGERMP